MLEGNFKIKFNEWEDTQNDDGPGPDDERSQKMSQTESYNLEEQQERGTLNDAFKEEEANKLNNSREERTEPKGQDMRNRKPQQGNTPKEVSPFQNQSLKDV